MTHGSDFHQTMKRLPSRHTVKTLISHLRLINPLTITSCLYLPQYKIKEKGRKKKRSIH